MSTKCIVLGKDTSIQPAKKPIEFVKQLNSGINTGDSDKIQKNFIEPAYFNYIELICPRRARYEEYDIMFAYDDVNHREEGILYLGHWNDGVVE